MWRPGEPSLPYNRSYAKKRLESFMASKIMQNPAHFQEYQNKVLEMLNKDYIREVPEDETRPQSEYFIPAFGVLKQERLSTKCRVVLDCKAKFNNKSLNDAIFPGPKLLPELPEVLLRARHRDVLLMGDISEMFLQVVLAPEDRPFHRFLHQWKKDGPIVTLEFQVHCFGNAGSPAVAVWVIQDLARRFQKLYPRAAEMILKSTYMDDNIDSFDTIAECIQVYEQLKKMYYDIRMTICKFASNNAEVMKRIPEAERAKGFEILGINEEMQMPTVKTLGLVWSTETDLFTYKSDYQKAKITTKDLTKRGILKYYSRFFDPLGLILPKIILARKIFQDCWKNETMKWDDQATDQQQAWESWLEDLINLESISYPRVLKPYFNGDKILSKKLHIFCDASGIAYAAVGYLRVEYENHGVYTNIAMARGKLAPMKNTTIPRLELLACQLGTKLARTIERALELKPEDTTYWTDSRNVLCWLRSDSLYMKMFVANRVNDILSKTKHTQWRWVNTESNPADVGSRGSTLAKLKVDTQWREGPEFLKKSEDKWPIEPLLSLSKEAETELKSPIEAEFPTLFEDLNDDGIKAYVSMNTQKSKSGFPIEKYSVFGTLIRHLGWLIKVKTVFKTEAKARKFKRETGKRFTRKNYKKNSQTLLPRDWHFGKLEAFKIAQRDAFSKEIDDLRKHKNVARSSALRSFHPYLDKYGMLRMGSRAILKRQKHIDTRNLIILPKNHQITTMYIRYIHQTKCEHVGGVNTTLNKINEECWIIHAKPQVNREVIGCINCRKRHPPPGTKTIMASLPDCRLEGTENFIQPFENTIVDAAGPFFMKDDLRKKHWVILYSCLTYRAIHLELIPSMSTQTFLNSFHRFVARRGVPKFVRSDNGTNFKGASNILRLCWSSLNNEEMKSHYPQIRWELAAPYAPHTNGAIERMVGLVKRALASVLLPGLHDFDNFETALIKIEGLVNSRPLTYHGPNPDDPKPLTPNDFLRSGNTLRDLAPFPEGKEGKSLEKYIEMEKILNHFWQRFVKEYVPTLHQRRKWLKSDENLKVGDIIILLTKEERRYPLARVTKVFVDKSDDVVRKIEYERLAKLQKVKVKGKRAKQDVWKKSKFIRHVKDVVKLFKDESHNL
jgi:Pao retrotransposon peptidase/Family of unknown function (DUF5641)